MEGLPSIPTPTTHTQTHTHTHTHTHIYTRVLRSRKPLALALHFHSSSYLVEIQKIMELPLRGPKPHMRMAEPGDRKHP